VPKIVGTGPTRQQVNDAQSLRLRGRTKADFDGGAFSTENVRVQRATGCAGCPAAECVRARGDLVVAYAVTTTVTLPRLSDFPDLTPCQQRRVQDAITNVLAPHEQQHVDAFRTYNGVTQTPFDLTLCRGQFDATIRSMFEAQEQARRAAAQAASDALDPFNFDVDLNCQDPPDRQTTTGPISDAAPPDEEDQA
jgi:hypothetical protein